MNKEELKIERWSVCERYKNYKSTNYYKEPLQFRPHPANVVRDVIMYHIYHNEGKQCNDDLIQYIKNKIINDLNEIFMLYKYAPDAIKTINRLMSSKRHLGTEDSYREMMFHALTIKDARDILIDQITNVLIKCIPEPLGNIKFETIMKGENMNDNTKESSIEEDTKNDREVRIENREKEFLNCKSETEKVMMFPRHDLVRLAVADIIADAVEKYHNEFDLVFKAWRKGEMKHISKETIVSSHIFAAMGTITQTFIINADVDKRIEDSIDYILNDSLNDPARERGIDHITDLIWYSSYDTYYKNVLAFPKSVEESSTDENSNKGDNMEQEETKTPKMKLRYLFRAWSDEYKPQPFIVKSIDKDEKYFEQTENVDGTPSTTRSHCLEVYIFNHLHKIFLTTFVWKKADDYDDEMVTSFLEFTRVRSIPVQLTLTRISAGYVNLHIETEDGNLWVDENCDDVMIESRNSTTFDTLCSGIEDENRFTIPDIATRKTIKCVSYMCTEISEEQKKRPVISVDMSNDIVIMSDFWISRVLETVSQYNECAYRFDRYEGIISCNTEEGTKKYKFKEFIDEVVEPIICNFLKMKYINECITNQTNNAKENE